MKSVASISGFSHGDVTRVGGQISVKFVMDSYRVTILVDVCIFFGSANAIEDSSHAAVTGASTGSVMKYVVMGSGLWVWV